MEERPFAYRHTIFHFHVVFQPPWDQRVISEASWPALAPPGKGGSPSGCWDAPEEQQQRRRRRRWDKAHPSSAQTPLQATHRISVGGVHQDLGHGPKLQEPSEQHGLDVSPGGGTRSGPGVCDAAG